MKFKLAAALTAMALASVSCGGAYAAPLLMDGKTTLYQRVLTTPSCVLKQDKGAKDGSAVPAFTRYYVYAREGGMLKVGPDRADKISGYIAADCAVDWKIQTSLMFTNSAGRTRAPIFEKAEALGALIEAADGAAQAEKLNAELDSSGAAAGIIAREPKEYVDYRQQFYLLPVLSSEESMFDDGTYTRKLEVASVVKQDGQAVAQQTSRIRTFKAALVFVIDSSISMQPYIDRTKQAISTIYKRLEQEHLQNSVQLGLVSFRSNVKAVPGLEYESRMFVNPGDANSVEAFSKKLKDLGQAKVSSKLFDEDAYAGISTALKGVNWDDYGGRYIVLITDAGAIGGSDALSSTGLDSRELRLEARQQGAAVYALHLLTDAGKKAGDHDKAKSQYEDLTFNEVLQKPLYYPVQAGDVKAFGSMVDSLADSIADQVKNASEGNQAAGAARAGSAKDALTSDTALLGHAMQLAYLGRQQGVKAPEIIRGWLCDHDLVSHNQVTATPVVLLTKSELSDLKDVTERVLDAASRGILSPDDMFSQLRSGAASMGRDPASLKSGNTLKLGEMGLLGEYLDDLPYKSRIQELDEETWMAMGPDEQNRAVEDLEQKIRYYQNCNDDVDRWVSLADGGDASEHVYPIPLEALP